MHLYSIYILKIARIEFIILVDNIRRNDMIGKDKTRLLLTIPKDFWEEMTKKAQDENRSLNNYIQTLLLKRNK